MQKNQKYLHQKLKQLIFQVSKNNLKLSERKIILLIILGEELAIK